MADARWLASLVERCARSAVSTVASLGPIRLRVACEYMRVMAAHKDSDTSYGHGLLLRLVSDCCDRCVAHGRARRANASPPSRWTPVARGPSASDAGSFPVAGGYRPPRPRSTNPAVAAAREQTSPAADAATGRPSALPGPSARRAPEHQCATRSCAPSCDDGAFAFVRRQSRTEQAADQPRGCEQQTPAPDASADVPSNAPTSITANMRLRRKHHGLTLVELVTAATTASRDGVAGI